MNSNIIIVRNKADLLPLCDKSIDITADTSEGNNNSMIITTSDNLVAKNVYNVSCLTGNGLIELEKALEEYVASLLSLPSSVTSNNNNSNSIGVVGSRSDSNREGTMITRERHRQHVKQCVRHLNRFLQGSHGKAANSDHHNNNNSSSSGDSSFGSLPMDAAAEELR